MKLGIYVYALASIATGVIDLVWGSFEHAHEPIQAFGDHVPGATIFAYIVGALLVAGGAAILSRRFASYGAAVLAAVYALFAIFWFPRLITAPLVLGYHAPVYIGVLGGVAQHLILVAAAGLIYASASNDRPLHQRWTALARWLFGLSAIDFGLAHLTGIAVSLRYVPLWMPFGQEFWVIFTGVAFVLSGIGILSGRLDVLAARLLALMLLVFSALALFRLTWTYPHNQIAWGANAYNLAAVAAVWILASWLSLNKASEPQLATST